MQAAGVQLQQGAGQLQAAGNGLQGVQAVQPHAGPAAPLQEPVQAAGVQLHQAAVYEPQGVQPERRNPGQAALPRDVSRMHFRIGVT